MLAMGKDDSTERGLVICDHAYQEKADIGSGGVGNATQIISRKVCEGTGRAQESRNHPDLPRGSRLREAVRKYQCSV